MFFQLFITGIVVGFLVAMPVGPIGILVIQRTVNRGKYSGLMSGFGAALADLVYAVVAGYSLTIIIDLIKAYQLSFQIAGSLLVIALGLFIFFKDPVADFRKFRRKGNTPIQDLTSTFLLTLANPIAIFAFLALFASSGMSFNIDHPYQNLFMVLGVFLGAFGWWFMLTAIVNIFKHRFNLRVLWWFNKIAGVSILFFVLISIIYTYFSDIKI
jgi:threonine/homoserine/homoserine lactone efflux protein